MRESAELLRDFATHGSEPAFAELIQRHIGVVYAAARRIGNGDQHFAEDVTQAVFTDFAAQASTLSRETIVAGWLYRHACFTAWKMIRGEQRRQKREEEAMAMHRIDQNEHDLIDLHHLRSVLDQAMLELEERDRDAVTLRFFEKNDFQAVGRALGLSPDAAQKRVSRALETLRAGLTRTGITMTAEALALTLAAESIDAPLGLAAKVTGSICTATAGYSLLFKYMGTTQFKIMAALSTAIALGIPLWLQHEEIDKLRTSQKSLQAQISETDRLRDENARLRESQIDLAELERFRKERLELQRLRGEVTLLRNQARTASARPREKNEDGEDHEAEKPLTQIMFEAKFFEVPLESLASISWVGVPSNPDESEFSRALSATETAEFIQTMQAAGIDLLAAPKVTTKMGREAQISIEASHPTEDTNPPSVGPFPGVILDVNPQSVPGENSINLTVDAKIIVKVESSENDPIGIPKFRVRAAKAARVLEAGQSLLMLGSNKIEKKSDSESTTTKRIMILVTPALIDPAGNRLDGWDPQNPIEK